MGLITDKDYIIHPPQVFIKNTIAVEKFRENYPDLFEKIECLVKRWVEKNICDIYSRINKIPPRKKGCDSRYRLRIPAEYKDINQGFNEILGELNVSVDGWADDDFCYWGIYEIMYYHYEYNMIEININGFHNRYHMSKAPRLWIIYIQF